MIKKVIKSVLIVFMLFLFTSMRLTQAEETTYYFDDMYPQVLNTRNTLTTTDFQIMKIKNMLLHDAHQLSVGAINKVLKILTCAAYHHEYRNILTIVDYSLPSDQKRLWIFDLHEMKRLFNTYVSHGIKSGVFLSGNFSNKYDSKASSLGVYKTDKSYYGRHGLSLKLDGLENGFNDHADGRAIVMHGGWYVDEPFIKKYGRAGRSWGCPAVPEALIKPIIDTIKENSLFIAYYPSETWLTKSKFLSCQSYAGGPTDQDDAPISLISEVEERDKILFADVHRNNRFTDSAPVVVMPAEAYERIFQSRAPLSRMLRRQIDNHEYIALSSDDVQKLITNRASSQTTEETNIYFVIANIKMVRGYYATEMKLVNLGHILDIQQNMQNKSYTVRFSQNHEIDLRASDQFIRWIGL